MTPVAGCLLVRTVASGNFSDCRREQLREKGKSEGKRKPVRTVTGDPGVMPLAWNHNSW